MNLKISPFISATAHNLVSVPQKWANDIKHLEFNEILGSWVAVFLTLAIFSFLYKDNPFYKFAEHAFIGVSAGYGLSIGFWTIIQPNLLGRL